MLLFVVDAWLYVEISFISAYLVYINASNVVTLIDILIVFVQDK